jgi:hypothetical protein
MKAVFIELPAFERQRAEYLDDDGFRHLQQTLMTNPVAGDVIEGSGGLRVIYYFWTGGPEFWLFTVYDKNEVADLTARQRGLLKERLKDELRMRRQ